MYEVMKSFISVKYYSSEEATKEILKVFLTTEELTPKEYAELCLIARDIYNPYIPPIVEETPEEEVPAE